MMARDAINNEFLALVLWPLAVLRRRLDVGVDA